MSKTISWIGTLFLIIGTVVNSLNIYPLGVIVMSIGGACWLITAVLNRDVPLAVTNVIMLLASLFGVIYNLLSY